MDQYDGRAATEINIMQDHAVDLDGVERRRMSLGMKRNANRG
jgi:hypothetical protein